MGTVQRSRRLDIDWLAVGPIGPYVDAFKQFLTERRYAATTSASYVAGIAHFARWARSRRLRLRRIDKDPVAAFRDGGFIKHSSQLSIAMTVLEVSRVADSIL